MSSVEWCELLTSVINSPWIVLQSLVTNIDILVYISADPLTIFAPTNAAFASLSSHTLHVLNNDVGLLEGMQRN